MKILALDYRIIEAAPPGSEEWQDHTWGYIDHEAQQIFLSPGMSEQMRELTLWHEILHAIDFQMDLNLSEQKVNQLALGIVSVLRDA